MCVHPAASLFAEKRAELVPSLAFEGLLDDIFGLRLGLLLFFLTPDFVVEGTFSPLALNFLPFATNWP